MFEMLTNIILSGIFLSLHIALPSSDYVKAKTLYTTVTTGPVLVDETSIGVQITAPYAVVVDKESGKILYQKKSFMQSPIASITKLMTALVFLDYFPTLEGTITIIGEDIKNGGQVVFRPGDTVTVKDAFYTSLISSSNEASMALARFTGLSEKEYIAAMNAKALALGLEQTFFIDPTGLEPANISTALEVAKLSKAAFAHIDIGEAARKKEYAFYTLNTKRRVFIQSTDKLLDSFINDPSQNYTLVGAKTGYIEESQYCFTAEVKKGSHTVIVSIVGSKTSEDRWNEAKGLVNWTFSNYRWSEP